MNSELKSKFKKLETQRDNILNLVQNSGEEKYHYSINGKWSVSQILTHLMISEKLSFGYMKKKSLGIEDLDNSGFYESMKSLLLKISQRLPFHYKAPKIVLENTPRSQSFEALQQEWKALHSELQKFLEKIEDKNLRKKIYKHPVAGRLNIIQAIDFFNEHIIHHLPQIKRLL